MAKDISINYQADILTKVNSQSIKRSAKEVRTQVQREIDSLSNQTDMSKLIRSNMPSSKSFKNYEAPLGRINGLVNDFDKSLAASNARVLAFGASVASVGAVEKAFSSLLSSTIEVQKALKELQVISEASNSQIAEYGNRLFDVARNTATSFKDATKAALEFSRQGLAMNQIIERTNDTMIMMRITGISLDEAINGLTATINAFSNEDLSSGEILNALSAIDLAAAASTDGIIKGMARSASAARSAGVSFRELAAFIATLQETTGLQGGVLGNSAKSIFTRIIDPSKLQTLKGFGIKVESDNGELLETMDILKNMAQTINGFGGVQVFGDRSELVKFLKEMSGLYQIDKLTALMNDLGKSLQNLPEEKIKEIESSLNGFGLSLNGPNGLKEGVDVLKEISIQIKNTSDEAQKSKLQNIYKEVEKEVSKYDRNLLNANQAVDEAYQKNALLNQTLDAQIQKLKITGIELGSAFGNTAFLDDLTSGLSTVNNVLEKITQGIKGEGSLSFLENVVQGIGSILTGPGLVLAIATIGKGISYMAKQTKDSWISFMDLNKASQRQIQYEQLLNNLYKNSADIQAVITDKTISRTAQAQRVISLLDSEVAKSQTLAKIYAEIAATMTSMTTLNVSQANIGAYQKGKFIKNKATGDNAFVKEQKAIQMGIGGARKNASPVIMNNFPLDGIKQTVVANTDELIVDAGNGKYKILNRNQVKELSNSKNFANGQSALFWRQQQGGPPGWRMNNSQALHYSGKNVMMNGMFVEPEVFAKRMEKAKRAFEGMNEPIETSVDSLDKLSKGLSDSSVQREKNLGNLIKWTLAASFLDGALLKVSDDSSMAAQAISYLGKALETFITLKMASSAFGFDISPKGLKESFVGSGRALKAGYGLTKGNFQDWRAGKSAQALSSGVANIPILGTITKAFKSLLPIIKSVGSVFSRMLGPISLLIAAWQLMPDSWTDSIKNGLGKAFGLIDTPAKNASKALENLSAELRKIDGEISGEQISNSIKNAIESYRVNEIASNKEEYKGAKNNQDIIDKSLDTYFTGNILNANLSKDFLTEMFMDNFSVSSKDGIIDIPVEEIKKKIGEAFDKGDWGTFYKGEFDVRGGLLNTIQGTREYSTRGNISYEDWKNQGGSLKVAEQAFIRARLEKRFKEESFKQGANEALETGGDKEFRKYRDEEAKKSAEESEEILGILYNDYQKSQEFLYQLSKGQGNAIASLVNLIKNSPVMSKEELEKHGISKENIERIKEIEKNIAISIGEFLSNIKDTLEKLSIINSIPTQLDSSLIRANIYSSPAEKIRAQGAVTQRDIGRNREANVLSMRQLATKFLEKNLTTSGSGFSKENLNEILGQINLATSAAEIQDAFIKIGKWGENLEELTPELRLKATEFFNALESKDLETASKELKDSINKASTALGEFDKYFQNTKFRTALKDLETKLADFSATIQNIDSEKSIRQALLSATATVNPSIASGVEMQKSQLDYDSNMRKIAVEQQRYFAEIEKQIVERISNLSSSQDKEDLMTLVNGIRRSDSGFTDIQEVSSLVGKIAKAEEESLIQENKQRIAMAIQELRSADMQYKAANIQLSAAEKSSKVIEEQMKNRQAKIGVQNILPDIIKNLPSVVGMLSGKKTFAGDNITEFNKTLLKNLEEAYKKASQLTASGSIEESAKRQQSFSMYGKTYDISSQKAQEELRKLQSSFSVLGNALNKKVNIQLTNFSSKIKQVSDAITQMRLNIEKDDVDLESQILLLPDEVKEVVRGFNLLDKANKELAVGQMEVAQANLEQRRSLLEATSRIENIDKRGEIVQQFEKGVSNDEMANIIGRALAEQDALGLKSTDIFKSSIDNFGKFNDIFKTAIEEFDKAVKEFKNKEVEEFGNRKSPSISSIARKRNSETQYVGMRTVNAGKETDIPSDKDLNSFEGYVEDANETAIAMSEFAHATNESTETTTESNEARKKSIDIDAKYQAGLLKNNDATNKATQAQINYQKALNEAKKFMEQFTAIQNKAITAATAAEKYSYQRQVNINEEGPKNIKGYENMTYMDAFKAATEKGEAGQDDLNKIMEQFNKRKEFKTFNEGWSESLAQMSDDAKRLEENMGKMIGTIKDGFVDVFTDAITGAKSFEDAMTDMVTNVANQIIKHGLNSLISNMFSGVAGLGSGGKQSPAAISASQSGAGGGIFSWLTNLFADGGQVVGGSGVRDDIPALLTGGEYVVKKDAVSRVGKDYLDLLNSGKISKFATGGYVKGRNTDRLYFDNGAYFTDTSKSNTGGNNGFYSPGKYGYGTITGRHNLRSFATQSFTSGQHDVINQNDTGGVIGLENESWRISAYGRNADTVENQTTEADKQEAFNLANQEQAQVDAAERERKKRKKSLWKSVIGMGAMIGLNYITGGIGGNSKWGLAELFGGSESSWGKGIQEFQGAFGNGPRGDDQVNILRGLFGMKKIDKKKASGGLITAGTAGRDTTPINAMQGEYVVSRNAARNAGTPFLDALNSNRVKFDNGTNQSSGPIGMDFSKLIEKLDEMINVVKEAFEDSAGNITVNVTENYNGSSQESQQGETSEDNQRLANRIKEVVRATILEEKRVGGMLNTTKA